MQTTRRPALFAGALAASLVAVSAFSVAAQSPDPMAENAKVLVLHASPDAPAVDIYVNGAETLSDVPFGSGAGRTGGLDGGGHLAVAHHEAQVHRRAGHQVTGPGVALIRRAGPPVAFTT